MAKNKTTIKYTATFINQFNNIIKYFINKLQNRIAAENLYNEVIKEIEKRSKNPESFEKYKSNRKRKNTYYRIYVKNYTIFYVVKNNTMEIRRILYSRRNFRNI
ncbi:MAG: type II toxin-antitoxin system RelE/ParE family toxin [Clostridia bacterium]|nr:type II toxin-antitoxin system RelE/ParE family toxin [Clostridia bacterium]